MIFCKVHITYTGNVYITDLVFMYMCYVYRNFTRAIVITHTRLSSIFTVVSINVNNCNTGKVTYPYVYLITKYVLYTDKTCVNNILIF